MSNVLRLKGLNGVVDELFNEGTLDTDTFNKIYPSIKYDKRINKFLYELTKKISNFDNFLEIIENLDIHYNHKMVIIVYLSIIKNEVYNKGEILRFIIKEVVRTSQYEEYADRHIFMDFKTIQKFLKIDKKVEEVFVNNIFKKIEGGSIWREHVPDLYVNFENIFFQYDIFYDWTKVYIQYINRNYQNVEIINTLRQHGDDQYLKENWYNTLYHLTKDELDDVMDEALQYALNEEGGWEYDRSKLLVDLLSLHVNDERIFNVSNEFLSWIILSYRNENKQEAIVWYYKNDIILEKIKKLLAGDDGAYLFEYLPQEIKDLTINTVFKSLSYVDLKKYVKSRIKGFPLKEIYNSSDLLKVMETFEEFDEIFSSIKRKIKSAHDDITYTSHEVRDIIDFIKKESFNNIKTFFDFDYKGERVKRDNIDHYCVTVLEKIKREEEEENCDDYDYE